MKAVIYIRWSTGEQSKGDSLRRQRELCEAFVERQGWTLADVIVEDGTSAFRGANHAAKAVLGDFEVRYDAGQFGDNPVVLVTEKLNRLSRQNARATYRWIDRLALKGISFATQNDGRVYLHNNIDLVEMMILLLEADAAHKFSKGISDHIAQSWAGKREAWLRGEGSPDPRIAPDWVSLIGAERETIKDGDDKRKRRRIMRGGHFELNDKVEVIRCIVDMALDQGLGINLIAKRLNQDGVPSLRGSTWTPGNIARMLKSRSLIGEYLPRIKNDDGTRARAEGADWIKLFPAAIEETRFYALQATIAGRRHMAGRKREANNLLQGLGACHQCGGPMAFRMRGEKRGRSQLQCRSNRFGVGCTAGQKYPYPPLEKAVLDLILPLALDPTSLDDGATKNTLDAELLALEAKLENKRQAARDLANLLEHSPSRTVIEKVGAMDAEIDRMEVERETISKRLAEARGKVSNAEHLRKVAEVRAIATAPGGDETARAAARRRIQQAFADLIEDIRFFPNKRRIVIKLIGDARDITLGLEGEIGYDFDWMKGGHVTPDVATTPYHRATLRNYDRRRRANGDCAPRSPDAGLVKAFQEAREIYPND